jgi:glucose/arabinose dehydrogenase
MKNPLILALLLLLSSISSFAQAPVNDNCISNNLNVLTSCGGTTGTLSQATATTVGWTGGPGSMRDVWYRVTVPVSITSITVSVSLNSNSQITPINTFVELFNSTGCPATTSLGSYDISNARNYAGLTANRIYLLRVATSHTNLTANPASQYGFTICITSNNECARAIPLITGDAPVNGTVYAATASSPPVGCATGTPDDDVWYRFTPTLNYAAISLTNIGSDLVNSGARIQVFTGTCGGVLTSLACGTNYVSLTGLSTSSQYYIRVYSANAGQTGINYGFKIMVTPNATTQVTAGRMKEVYLQQVISPAQALADPWEITYGPDNKLWVTEAKGYRVYKINPVDGARDMILDISQGSTFLPAADQSFNCQFYNGEGAQGGFAGMALHPKFLDATTPKNYVYVAYVHSRTSSSVFTNRIVRFTYNTTSGRLESPVSLCDTLPGSNDHNSQRMIIAPIGGVDYLFYAQGDMGAGQFANKLRTQKAQLIDSYEGKILRFNLETDGDAGTLDRWIPSATSGDAKNPFNDTLEIVQSAVWSTGIRNNQGFAYDSVLNKLYGSSHGPYSDDEINVIERGKNYGHPIVIGYAADGNVNNTTAGASPNMPQAHPSSCPIIVDEKAAAIALGSSYKDPLFSAYANSPIFPTIQGLWSTTSGANADWPSEGWSGLGLYTHTLIPGWNKSLVAASLKWGRLVRLRLNKTGDTTFPSNTAADTVSYFGSVNKYRDMAFAPNGRDIYVVMDRGTSNSGPAAANPIVPACAGCLQKYTFLGYGDVAGQSSIDTSIDVTHAAVNSCNTGTTVTIDASNNNLWVPITGPDGNIMAEIFANGKDLGTVTSSFYKNSTGSLRLRNGSSYADRNVTITPQYQPTSGFPVKVRIYISKKEYEDLDNNALSGITGLSDLRLHKNSDPCQSAIAAATSIINPDFKLEHGDSAYVLQADNITGFSTFYIGSTNVLLPLTSLNFKGKYKNEISYLSWETSNESNTDHFEVERNTGDGTYTSIGTVVAKGNNAGKTQYTLNDDEASKLGTSRLYYRLKVTDRDGSYTYSNVVVVDIPGSFITRISVFPNPADKQATLLISSPEEQKITWQLVDVTGRSVMTKNTVIKKGENKITIDLNTLRTGVYFLQVNGRFVNAQEKIQKL